MKNLINAFPLYNFLKYCNSNHKGKRVLDCGAGGSNPPLSLFYEFGYKTYGIELDENQLKRAEEFSIKHNIDLNLSKGDMRNLPFDDNFFDFLYSYNTSVHIGKKDFAIALEEFLRVLKPKGLCYVNFLSEDCTSYGKGIEIEPGKFKSIEDGEEVVYCHYKDDEPENYFQGFKIIYSEKRIIRRYIDEEEYISGYLDYILEKK